MLFLHMVYIDRAQAPYIFGQSPFNEFFNTDSNVGFNNFGGNVAGSNSRPGSNFGNTGAFGNTGTSNDRGSSNINNNNNRGNNNRGENSNFNSNNNRGTSSSNINNNSNRGTNNYDNFNTNNRPANNINNNNDGGFHFPTDNPLINRPGVQPAPVNTALPPITNRPVTDNYFNFNRPADPSSFEDQPSGEPEILTGPDEDDMPEWQKRRYADEAERMCDYYKSLTVTKVVVVSRVLGGSVTTIEEYPHMALVGWKKLKEDGYSWKCGGSLISDRYVLTAGHCAFQNRVANVVSGPPQAVQLGSSYRDDPGALVMKISAVIRHPKYKMGRSYHDIAMIKMVSKVQFSEVIRPACLGRPPPVGSSVIATGWGRTELGGDLSNVLRSVSLNVWDMQECQAFYGTSLKLPNGVTPDSHMCASDRAGGNGTCQGDSGGPAQIQDGGLWRVVGVTSSGRSCGAPDTPTLYAVIPHAFIAAQVFGDSS